MRLWFNSESANCTRRRVQGCPSWLCSGACLNWVLMVCSRLGKGRAGVTGWASRHGHPPARPPLPLALASHPACTPCLLRGSHGPPEEGAADHLPGPALQREGELLLRLRNLGRGLLRFKERVEETKPEEGGRPRVSAAPSEEGIAQGPVAGAGRRTFPKSGSPAECDLTRTAERTGICPLEADTALSQHTALQPLRTRSKPLQTTARTEQHPAEARPAPRPP